MFEKCFKIYIHIRYIKMQYDGVLLQFFSKKWIDWDLASFLDILIKFISSCQHPQTVGTLRLCTWRLNSDLKFCIFPIGTSATPRDPLLSTLEKVSCDMARKSISPSSGGNGGGDVLRECELQRSHILRALVSSVNNRKPFKRSSSGLKLSVTLHIS